MTQEQLIADISDVVILYTFWVTALVPVAVASFWRWWRHELGWTFVIMDVLLALALSPAAARRMFGIPITSPGFEWFTLAAIALIAPVTVWRVSVLWRVQRGPRNPRRRRKA